MSGDPKGKNEDDTARGIPDRMTESKGLPKASSWPVHPLPAPPLEEPEEEPPSVRLTYDETVLLRENWLRYGKVGDERLSGEVDHDLDVLARAVLILRTSPARDVGRDSSTRRQPEILRRDPLYQQILNGPIARHYSRWEKNLNKIPSNPDTTPIRHKKGETVEAIEVRRRQLAWLYAKYVVDDWGDWYEKNIKPNRDSTEFLSKRVIWGLHPKAVNALKAAEVRLLQKMDASKAKDLLSRIKALGGGYNARGWREQLGDHDFGMAFDLQAGALNVEIRGALGIAWATYGEGKNLIFLVKLLTGFDVYGFVKQYYKYAMKIKSGKGVSADDSKRIAAEIKAAYDASEYLMDGLLKEIDEVKELGMRIERWERYIPDLLAVAKSISDYKEVFPPILAGAEKKPLSIVKRWERFLLDQKKKTENYKDPNVIRDGFFNIPPRVIEALIDPTAPANLRFHWVPFHHFQLASWREELRSEGIRIP